MVVFKSNLDDISATILSSKSPSVQTQTTSLKGGRSHCGKITESIQRKSPCFLLLISRSAREGKQSLTSGEKGGVEGDLLILFDPLNLTSVPAQSF